MIPTEKSGDCTIAAVPSVPLGASRPSRRIRWTLYVIGIAVWVTGVLYWTFDHYMLRHTDIGVSENPLQVWWLYLHAGTATLATWLLGYMSAIHVQRNWPVGLHRSSGLLFVTVFGLLVLTGYLLYYVEEDRPEMLLISIHWIIGLCAPAAFLLHRGLRPRRGLLPVQPALPSAVPLAQQLSAAEPRIGHSPGH